MIRNLQCGACGGRASMAWFEDRQFSFQHAGADMHIDHLSGWRCNACGEVEFDPESAARYAAADDAAIGSGGPG